MLPEYAITATSEHFTFYDIISKASSEHKVDSLSAELRDQFGPLPEEVANLLQLTKLKITYSALGLEKIDLQPQNAILFLPDQDNEHLADKAFLQYLFVSAQEPWMTEYKPGFKMNKKMKPVLHHPAGSDTTPAGLLHRYTELLQKPELASKAELA